MKKSIAATLVLGSLVLCLSSCTALLSKLLDKKDSGPTHAQVQEAINAVLRSPGATSDTSTYNDVYHYEAPAYVERTGTLHRVTTFSNATDAATGYTINGAMTITGEISAAYTLSGSELRHDSTYVTAGSLTLSGSGPIKKAVFNLTTHSVYDGTKTSDAYSGTITCNDVDFNVSDFSFDDYGTGTNDQLDNSKSMLSFYFSEYFSISGVIDEAAGTITVTLPVGASKAALTAVFFATGVGVTVNGVAQYPGTQAANFTNPVVYRVTAEDGSYKDYTVTVVVPPPCMTILGSFASPGTATKALEWDGSHLWIVDSANKFFKVDATGTVLNSFVFTEEVYDLAWDGAALWAYTYGGLKRVDSSGAVTASLSIYYFWNSGFAWDGSTFWVGDFNFSEIHNHAATGAALGQFDAGFFGHATGIAFDGSDLLIGDSFELYNRIYKYSRAGVGLAYVDFDEIGLGKIDTFEYKSLAWDGQYLWYSSTGRSTIYKIRIDAWRPYSGA